MEEVEQSKCNRTSKARALRNPKCGYGQGNNTGVQEGASQGRKPRAKWHSTAIGSEEGTDKISHAKGDLKDPKVSVVFGS